ncbi:hypothetical protein MMC34_000926 [Xylographa carneopallida]|nr:hypothetical protein [Xylographa carneopallida]
MSASSKESLLAVSGSLTGLSITFIGLRFYARRQQKLSLMADDWIVIPALVSVATTSHGPCFVSVDLLPILAYADLVYRSSGVHDKTLGYSSNDFTAAQTIAMAQTEQQLDFVIILLISGTFAFTKLSALFFYRRVFCVGHYMWYVNFTTITGIVIVSCWLVTFELLAGLECGTHFSALWDGTYAQYCSLSFRYLYGLTVSDFLLDIWILALPIPIVRPTPRSAVSSDHLTAQRLQILRLHATRTKKLSIIGLFLLAFVGLGASIARLVLIITVQNGGASYLLSDQERVGTLTSNLSMLEAGMSLVAVNLPSLSRLFTTMIPTNAIGRMRNALWLPSLRRSHPENMRAAPASISTTHLNRKPGVSSSSTNSGRPAFGFGFDFSPSPFRPQTTKPQLRDDLGDRTFETYVMHEVDSKERGQEVYLQERVARDESTLELGGEEEPGVMR